ncbi:MAG: LysR family transcriptional regulator [Methylobacterium mesophilicum]|nr:LysR family transcriptional regulator [Methylobacterium mesophilicum]
METIHRRLLPSTAALAAFDAVARLGSISAAADALALTPGAVSRQIALLEERLGIALILRTNKGVALTDKGRRYAEGVARIIRDIHLLSLDAMADGAASALHLAILPTFGTRWLLPRIPDFVARHPNITLSFATRIGRVDFAAERLDAAIHIGEPDWPGCEFRQLMREQVAPVCSPAFLATNPVLSPDALLDMPLFELASRPNAWKRWFKGLGIEAPHREGMRFEQFLNVSQACAAGLGVALMPLFLIDNELASGQLVQIFPWSVESPNSYYFVTPAASRHRPPVRQFETWLAGQIEAFVAERKRAGDAARSVLQEMRK